MATRQLTVWPDEIIRTPAGEIAVVSDEAFYAGLMKIGQMVPVGGGQVIAVVDRVSTGVPNESVTVRAIFEWKNHSQAKPQPEPHVDVPTVDPVRLTDEARESIIAAADTTEDGEAEVRRFEAEANAAVSYEDDVDRAIPTAVA